MNGRALIAVAAAIALLLVGGYAALGGGSGPPETADPCEPRPFPKPQTNEELAERLTLSALDGAACELGVSREAVALAIASDQQRARFAETHDLDDDQVESALRAGILRAIEDAQRADAIDPASAAALATAARVLPLEALVDGLRDANRLTETLGASTTDPCQPHSFPPPETNEALLQQLALTALEAAACDLEVSRDELTLALVNEEERRRFAERHGLADTDVEDAIRAGALRAIDRAESADAIEATAAMLLRAAARTLPLESVIENLQTR
jgi:hypothetical protein